MKNVLVIGGGFAGINLATPIGDIRRDSDLFLECTKTQKFQLWTAAAMEHGFQTSEGELDLARKLSEY